MLQGGRTMGAGGLQMFTRTTPQRCMVGGDRIGKADGLAHRGLCLPRNSPKAQVSLYV